MVHGVTALCSHHAASWDLDSGSDGGKVQFNEERIESSVFFDIDNVSDKCASSDHMLPSPEVFQEHVGKVVDMVTTCAEALEYSNDHHCTNSLCCYP